LVGVGAYERLAEEFKLLAPCFVADHEEVEEGGCDRQSEGKEAGHPIEEEQQSIEVGAEHRLPGDGKHEGNSQEYQANNSSAAGGVGWHARSLARSRIWPKWKVESGFAPGWRFARIQLEV
jgi:hypothetical protein